MSNAAKDQNYYNFTGNHMASRDRSKAKFGNRLQQNNNRKVK